MVPAGCGLVYPAGEGADGLATTIDRALRSPWNRDAIAEQGRRRTWDTVAGEVRREWELAIGGYHARSAQLAIES